jgi:hypothetical protein
MTIRTHRCELVETNSGRARIDQPHGPSRPSFVPICATQELRRPTPIGPMPSQSRNIETARCCANELSVAKYGKLGSVGFDQHFTTGKLVLFGGSAFASLVIGTSIGAAASSFGVGLLAVVAAFPAYVFAGAHATRAAEDLMKWGFPEEEPWTIEQRLMYGAAWPAVLLFWLVVSAFNKLVTDLYR